MSLMVPGYFFYWFLVQLAWEPPTWGPVSAALSPPGWGGGAPRPCSASVPHLPSEETVDLGHCLGLRTPSGCAEGTMARCGLGLFEKYSHQRETRDGLWWPSWISLPITSISLLCPFLQLEPIVSRVWSRYHLPTCGVLTFVSGFGLCIFHLISFFSTAGPWWRRGISTGIRSALCALTATSTSSKRATSSWRGSCTAKLMHEPARGPRRATTQSLFIPELKS